MMKYHVISGTLRLKGRKELSGSGETTDKAVQDQLRDLAKITNGFGQPAYVVIDEGKSEGEGSQGGQGGTQTPPSTQTPSGPDLSGVKLPDGAAQRDFEAVGGYLHAAGYTFEQAAALDDETLDKIDNIAAGRIKLIRAVAAVNGYAGPAAQE
ncbi:hypothetical protein DM785_02660 [Deinococcus actinosclerus]|nr:hypothetical protein DM785_02660 [Deinococcus actinosclerus]